MEITGSDRELFGAGAKPYVRNLHVYLCLYVSVHAPTHVQIIASIWYICIHTNTAIRPFEVCSLWFNEELQGLSTNAYNNCVILTHLQSGFAVFLTSLFPYCAFYQFPCYTVFLESEKVVITFPI